MFAPSVVLVSRVELARRWDTRTRSSLDRRDRRTTCTHRRRRRTDSGENMSPKRRGVHRFLATGTVRLLLPLLLLRAHRTRGASAAATAALELVGGGFGQDSTEDASLLQHIPLTSGNLGGGGPQSMPRGRRISRVLQTEETCSPLTEELQAVSSGGRSRGIVAVSFGGCAGRVIGDVSNWGCQLVPVRHSMLQFAM